MPISFPSFLPNSVPPSPPNPAPIAVPIPGKIAVPIAAPAALPPKEPPKAPSFEEADPLPNSSVALASTPAKGSTLLIPLLSFANPPSLETDSSASSAKVATPLPPFGKIVSAISAPTFPIFLVLAFLPNENPLPPKKSVIVSIAVISIKVFFASFNMVMNS